MTHPQGPALEPVFRLISILRSKSRGSVMACLPVSRFPKLQVVPKAHISRVLSKRQGFRRVLAPALQRPGLFLLVCQSRSSVELFFCSTKSWSWSSPTKRKGVPSAWNFPLEPLKELLDLVPNGTSQFKYFRTGLPPHGQAPLCRVPDRNTGACRFVPVPARIFSVPAKKTLACSPRVNKTRGGVTGHQSRYPVSYPHRFG